MSGRRDPLRTRRVMLILRAIGVGGSGLARLLLPLMALATCDSGPTGPDGKGIGQEGGTASLAGGSVTLSIPADALSAEVRFTATRVSSYPPSDLIVEGSIYEVQPSGVGFARLVWLTLSYDLESLPEGVRESELRLFEVVGNRWEMVVNATVDTKARTVSGSVWSLGTFGAMGIPVAEVLVSPASYTLEQGQTKGLTAVGLDASGMSLPERGITWASSKENVATVSADGLVTAVGVGSATVTATAEGRIAYSSISTWSCAGQTEIPATECQALIDWFNGANAEDWRTSPRWVPTPYPCGWLGVTCEEGSVSRLGPYSGSLPGFIAPSIGQLTNLEEIHFSNQLTGPIPKALGSLPKLTVLNLWGNNLSGPIPSELQNLGALTVLRLANNNITGPIPAGLGSLSRLTDLDLRWNELSGPIPPELAGLSNLTHLGLMDNQLSGVIPLAVAQLGGLIQSRHINNCLFAPSGNTGLSMPDTQAYRDADLNGDGKICGVAVGSG